MSISIPYDDLRLFAYSNDKLIEGKINGIVISFIGLGNQEMFGKDTDKGIYWAKEGIIYLQPYINPWAWMNRDAVKYTDACVEELFDHYSLDGDTPIVSTGGSMGGLCAIVYCSYAKRVPAACAANCPVCDLPYHYTERPDLPHTLVSAFGGYDMPLADAIKTASPLHLADSLPDIDYYVVHCEEDEAVNKQMHSDRFVAELRKDHRVTYSAVPGRGHCDLTLEAWAAYDAFIRASINK